MAHMLCKGSYHLRQDKCRLGYTNVNIRVRNELVDGIAFFSVRKANFIHE
jgi:hypothetical protein